MTEIRLVPWGPGDAPLLARILGDPAMTRHLGGPEDAEKLAKRQARYEALRDGLTGRTLKVLADDEPAGWVGYWDSSWRGAPVFEMGWSIVPEMQGRGIATRAARMALDAARSDARHDAMLACPSVDNAASNAVCRKLGFVLIAEEDVEYPAGAWMRAAVWRLALR